MTPVIADLPAKMLARVAVAESGCWLWTGSCDPSGYGTLKLEGRTRRAHRLAYELLVGPIPDGLQLDHLCRVRNCANPDHLEPVTNQENSRRGRALITHCPKGHPYSGDNLRLHVRKNGRDVNRECRECVRAAMARERPPLALDDPRHGTVGGYTYHRCRCAACKHAASQRRRKTAA